MDYSHIKNYFEKFKIILSTKEEEYSTVSKIIEKRIGVCIDSKNIIIKNKNILVKTSPLIKNEILIKKNYILKDLKDILGCSFFDIK